MDEDRVASPTRKRSREVICIDASPDPMEAQASGSISPVSSHLQIDASVPLSLHDDSILIRLDALATCVRQGETERALQRIEEIRVRYLSLFAET